MTKFEQACLLAFEDWADDIPDDLPEPEYSEKHKRWVKKLFNKMRGDRYHRFTTNTVKVMLVAAVLSALLLTAFVIPSSREFIIDKFDIYSTYKLTEDNGNSVNGEITVGYIPEGFEMVDCVSDSKYIFCEYESNDDSYFSVYKCTSSMKIEFDTENMDAKTFVKSEVLYTYSLSSSGVYNIMWIENDYVYRMSGNLSIDDLLKVAESVK